MDDELKRRFWSKVQKVSRGCWRWTSSVAGSGYGVFKLGGRRLSAHRVAWELANGPIPPGSGWHGTCVLHRCDNRICVRPSHLVLGTMTDNNRDAAAKGRSSRFLPDPLPGESNPNARLTNAQARAVRRLRRSTPARQIAVQFGVSLSTIKRVLRHESYSAEAR